MCHDLFTDLFFRTLDCTQRSAALRSAGNEALLPEPLFIYLLLLYFYSKDESVHSMDWRIEWIY